MPFIKNLINKWKVCLSPEHNPPTHIVLEPGVHVWKCPSCGEEITFEVPEIIW